MNTRYKHAALTGLHVFFSTFYKHSVPTGLKRINCRLMFAQTGAAVWIPEHAFGRNRRAFSKIDTCGAVCNRGPHPLLGRGVPTRYWEGTLDCTNKSPNYFFNLHLGCVKKPCAFLSVRSSKVLYTVKIA